MATSLKDIATYYAVDGVEPEPGRAVLGVAAASDETLARVSAPNYNVAPTDPVPIVIEPADERLLAIARWGFIPFWDKSNKPNAKMINARCESVATKNAFKRALRSRRCIVPADGFYEWQRSSDGRKQPFYIQSADGEPMSFAGLYSNQRDDTGSPVSRSATILTGPPSGALAALHDRMPIMVDPSRWEAWLAADNDDVESFADLFAPSEIELKLTAVSPAVNKVANNGPELIEPVEPASLSPAMQTSLFESS